MRFLLIGGTHFLGRHLSTVLLARGHDLTLFHRGKTNPNLFPAAKEIFGDRNGGLSALEFGKWDCVIDTCAYFPRQIKAAATTLKNRCGHYTFVSSISVYENFESRRNENSPLAQTENPEAEAISAENYGALKALCEKTLEDIMPGRCLNARSGLIVGPFDPTDRFSYWLWRFHQKKNGGDVLAPQNLSAPLQFIDGRDLAEWLVQTAERSITGTYNVSGPTTPLAFGDFLTACKENTQSEARLVLVKEEFLLAQNVQAFVDLPLWLPAADKKFGHFMNTDVDKALKKGLTFRPLRNTLKDLLEWMIAEKRNKLRAGIPPEREKELLELYEKEAGAQSA